MSEKAKWQKAGVVLKGDKGSFIVLGDEKNRDPKYNFNVTITVTDTKGKVLHEQTNGLISLFDPRKRPGISDEQAERVPANLKFELMLKK